MAIDTGEKRRSVRGRSLRFLRRLPLPDGTVDAGDRQQLLGRYRGIVATSTIDYVPPPVASVVVYGRPAATVQGPS